MATITVEGQLTDDVDLRISEAGKSWATGRLLENHSKRNDDGSYEDLRPLGFNFVVFGRLADNAVESLKKGMRVRVEGELEPNDYVQDGEKHEGTRIVVTSITPSLRYATATITKNPKADTAPAASGAK